VKKLGFLGHERKYKVFNPEFFASELLRVLHSRHNHSACGRATAPKYVAPHPIHSRRISSPSAGIH